MSVWWSDTVRFAGILLGGLLVPALVAVAALHWRVWRRMRAQPGRGSGLLPLHVWLIASSYALMDGLLVSALLDGIGRPASSWRLLGYPIAFGLGIVALVVVGYTQRRRIRVEQRITVATEETVAVQEHPGASS